jgi:predicted nucleotidyltransferase
MTAEEAIQAVIDALDAANVPFMIVGSLSSSYYGKPRSTADADFVVQLEGRSVRDVTNRLGNRFELDPQMSFETVTGTIRYVIRVRDIAFKIELFALSDDDYDQERFRRRVSCRYLDRPAFVASAEDVIVMKLRWMKNAGRRKDEDDIRNVMRFKRRSLDWSYLEEWCGRHGTLSLLNQVRAEVEREAMSENPLRNKP